MRKQPETLIAKTASGGQSRIVATHSEIPKRIKVPIPPPRATNQYLRINSVMCHYPSLTGRSHQPGQGGLPECRPG